MKLVSVIVPVYNVEKYLKVCVDSIISQTYKNLEIILVDDGSSDNCPMICDNYSKIDERVIVLHKSNGGLSDARNAGIKIASGDFLFFVDSDDYIVKDTIEVLVGLINKTNADVSACSYTQQESQVEVGNAKKEQIINSKKALKYIFSEQKLNTSASAKLFKKDLFCNIEFPVKRIYEDYATIYKVLDRAERIVISQVKKYYYRPNPSSITGQKFYQKQLEYFSISDEVMSFVKEKYPTLKKHVDNRATRMAVSFYKKISETNYDNLEDINFLMNLIRKNSVKYLFSGYNIKSKMYALFISLFPQQALKFFKNKR